MKLSREKILRMFDGTGSGSGGSVDIDGVASESWVGSKYLSKDFIAQTINWYDGTDIVIPNDTKSDIDLIEFAVNASFRGDVDVLGNLKMAGRLVATQEWVGRNYVSISFFDAVFQVFNNTTKIAVNGDIPADTSKMNIKAMFGFWTDFYVTALGRGIAQPTVVNVLNDLADVSLGSPLTNGQALVYSSSLGKWTNGEPTAGTVTRIGMTVPSGFTVSPSAITSSGTFAITFANGYSLPTNTKQSNWDAAYSKAFILEGYFDANGNTKSALKLTTVNKTAWGQTYWTSGGVPTSISGNMTDVGDITMNGSNRINPNGNSIYIGNSNNAGWVYMADMCSQSGNTYWNIKHNGDADFANLTMAGKLVATQEWVGRNYVSISFFDAVFQVFNNTTKIAVNGTIPADTSKMNIKAMFGFWTDFYVTALGRGIAQPTVVNVLNDLADVSLGSPLTNGQALVYSSSLGKWTNGEPTAGTVTRIGMTVPSGFTVSPSAITSSGTFAITFANGYSLPTNTKQSNWDAAYTDRHTHSNKTVLDGISATKVSNWDAAYTDRHTHSNKTVLDGITAAKVSNWDAAYTDRHTHSNKTVLDGISATKVSNWDAAYTDRHTHSNKTVLDGISSTKVSNWDTAYSKALVLEGYFDANGNAKSALKLTTVSKTAWGQTYWTSGGVPASISGNMTGVGNITMNGSNRIDPNGNSIYIGNSNNAGWVYMADMCSQSGSSYWNIKHSGNAEFANVYSAGYVTALSDIRYKDVVDRFYLDAETIAQTSVIRFKMKDGDDKRTHAGGIAQEWQKILPEVVVEDERGRLSMDYGTIGMIAAVSLAREIINLKEDIKILRKQLGI